ncbi:MAG TPA: cytochrome c [Dehalococcoidia bacterium]|nr:cytochrome c [Dehalococcoidia bacterium]
MGRHLPALALTAAALLAACGREKPQAGPAAPPAAAAGELTPFELENGVGPITQPVQLDDDIDQALAAKGKALFETKCSACHKLAERYVGPPLGEVTTRRTGAYIMNMILNPEGMYTRHPVAKQLLGEYMTQMPNLGVTQEEARQLLEYLRAQVTRKAGS